MMWVHTVNSIINEVHRVTSVTNSGAVIQPLVNPTTNQVYTLSGTNFDTVKIIDGKDNSISTLPALGSSGTMALNVVTNKVYITQSQPNRVAIVDGNTKTITTVSLPLQPNEIAVNSVTNKVYISLFPTSSTTGDGGFAVIDGGNNNSLSVITTGTGHVLPNGAFSYPGGMQINPNTNQIFFLNYEQNSSGQGVGTSIGILDSSTTNYGYFPISFAQDYLYLNPVTNIFYLFTAVDTLKGYNVNGGEVSSISIPGNVTNQMVINSQTNKIYVGSDTSQLLVIDGATNSVQSTINLTGIPSLAVNQTTNHIFALTDDTLNIIDGNTNGILRTVNLGESGITNIMAVNSVTNRCYLNGSSSILVVDDNDNTVSTVANNVAPKLVDVNTTTGRVFTLGQNGTLNVYDGSSNNLVATTTVGNDPRATVVNPITNQVFTANYGSNSVSVIDGSTFSQNTINVGIQPAALALNPVTKRLYVANSGSNNLTVIDTATNSVLSTVTCGTTPQAVAVNPVTNKIYVANFGSNTVTVINGATNSTSTVNVGSAPIAIAVNPLTNRIYVANSLGSTVTEINGSNSNTAPISVGLVPVALAVNQTTNTIFVVNQNSGTVSVIQAGNGNMVKTVTAGQQPFAVAVNQATNRIYVANSGSGNLTVIDGASVAALNPVTVGATPSALIVNPALGKVYVANSGATTMSVVLEQNVQPNSLSVAITPLTNDTTTSATPTFNFTASNTFIPPTLPAKNIFFQVDSWSGTWTKTIPLISGSGTGTTTTLKRGIHTIYAFATDGQDSSLRSILSLSSKIGTITAYNFLVDAPDITINPPTLPDGQLNIPYSQTVAGSGGSTPYTYSKTMGALPTGLSLNSLSGIISGTPTATGSFNFTITAVDNNGLSGDQTYTVTIGCSNCGGLFVADTYNNRVQRYNGSSWSVVSTPALNLPEAVTASADGLRIYVADTGNNKVIYSTDAGGTWANFAVSGLTGPQGLAVDTSGHLYVSNTGGNQVLRYDENTPLGTPLVLASGGTGAGQVMSPRGLAIDSSNRLFITDQGNSRILRIPSANGTPGTTFQVAGTGGGAAPFGQVKNPEGVAVDSAGNLFVADTGNNRVLRFAGGNNGAATVLCTLSGSLTAPPLGQVRGAEGVAIVDAGLLGGTAGQAAIVVSDTQNRRIQGSLTTTSATGYFLVGTPNGSGSGTGQFNSPGKIK